MNTFIKALLLPSGAYVPYTLYGTAWKQERTSALVTEALEIGFQGLDTANFPASYDERLVGTGVAKALEGGINREDIWIQTKFAPAGAHPPDQIPFLTSKPLESQIRESIEQSLAHLQSTYIDIFILHVPFDNFEQTLSAWKVFETYVPHIIHHLGISNVNLASLRQLYNNVALKPVLVQNRFWADNGYDKDLRVWMKEKGIIYQAYGMLRFCNELVQSELVAEVACLLEVEQELALYILILGLGGTCILDGTTQGKRMRRDLEVIHMVSADRELQGELRRYFIAFEALVNTQAQT
ncbi:MAG: hypothetical protein M1812_000664 [Candelaria pacifica]|nr:MAG: hypothetical protein M1812_000664 [Candelaria pacifica]